MASTTAVAPVHAGANESDEAFARRLQAQELGSADQDTPLVCNSLYPSIFCKLTNYIDY